MCALTSETMELITFIRRVKSTTGGEDSQKNHLTVRAYIEEASFSDALTIDADLAQRATIFRVVNSPAIRNLPKDVTGIRYDGVLYGIRNLERGAKTAKYVVFTADEAS